jgi:hypothetical protein
MKKYPDAHIPLVILSTFFFLALMLVSGVAQATIYEGIDFPAGAASFADAVVAYEPDFGGGPVPALRNQEAQRALGIPRQPPDLIDVSLGNGGRITLQFTDNSLVGSGDRTPDLWVFEVGSNLGAWNEPTFVEISTDGIVWHPVGMTLGGIRGIDIDAFGFGPDDHFSFVRLTDDDSDAPGPGGAVGADIDAVGASTCRIKNPDNGHWYQIFDDTVMTWHDAKAHCESMDGYLATITSKQENDFVFDNLVNPIGHDCWLGGTDEANEGNWQWITGEAWEYSNWDPGEPNDDCGGEDYLHLYDSTGFWNDLDNYGLCWSLNYPICEWDELVLPLTSGQSYPGHGKRPETCTLPNSGVTTWYIGVHGYHGGSFTITATLSGGATILQSGQSQTGTVSQGQWEYYQITSTASDTQIRVELTDLSDDVDLYVMEGSQPDTTDYDCRPYSGGKRPETCTLPAKGQRHALCLTLESPPGTLVYMAITVVASRSRLR